MKMNKTNIALMILSVLLLLSIVLNYYQYKKITVIPTVSNIQLEESVKNTDKASDKLDKIEIQIYKDKANEDKYIYEEKKKVTETVNNYSNDDIVLEWNKLLGN